MKGRKKDLASRPINHPRKQSTQGLVESSVDVSSVLLRSDNASVVKGNILSVCWYWFRNSAIENSSMIVYSSRAASRTQRGKNAKTSSREEVPRLEDLRLSKFGQEER
jgi:hypothetical protein